MSIRDLKATLAAIAVHQSKIEQNERMAENLLGQITSQLVGRRVMSGGGKLRGEYEICAVRIAYQANIYAKGYKIAANGKPGRQAWDLGQIHFGRLLPVPDGAGR